MSNVVDSVWLKGRAARNSKPIQAANGVRSSEGLPADGGVKEPDWQISPDLLRGRREVVTFDNSGIAIVGDFTVTHSTNARISMADQFFIQFLLDGHDILPAGHVANDASAGRVLFGRLKTNEQTSFVLPSGGRWHSLYIGISDRAVEHMWGEEPDRLVERLRGSHSPDDFDRTNVFESCSSLPISKRNVLEQVFNCTLPGTRRAAFIWSRSLELMVDMVANALAEGAHLPGELRRSRTAIKTARDIMHQELGQPHTIDSLAFRVGLGRRDFMRSFKEEFGVTFHDYYMQVRMQRAAELLADGGIRVTEVSERVGYTQLSSFSRAFKAFYGTSPCTLGEARPSARRM